MSDNNTQATPEQVLYAVIQEKLMLAGLLLMFITFALYLLGIMDSVVPLDKISTYWRLPVHDYLAAINAEYLHAAHPPTGWAWLKFVGKGDFLNFLPIAILAGTTIVCYLAIVPGLFRRGDKAYGFMALVEAVILTLAASGLLAVGGH